MNWNRRKALPKWEKRRIYNRHDKYLRKERTFAYKLAIAVLVVVIIGVVVGGVVK